MTENYLENSISQLSVTRPALHYFGAKFRLSKWIIGFFPEHTTYVEPFGGAMGVLLNKDPSPFEIYNDLDGEVVNFFRTLRDFPDQLIRAIELTPFSREEQRRTFEPTNNLTDLERARRLYVRAWQSHGGGRTQWATGWRYQTCNTRGIAHMKQWNQIDHLMAIVKRLKEVQIENDNAFTVIRRFDKEDALFYIDPPYLLGSVKNRKSVYQHNLSDDQHIELLDLLCQLKGMVAVSGKPSDLYDEHLPGWRKIQKTTPTNFQSRSVECLWLSPNLVNHQRQLRMM